MDIDQYAFCPCGSGKKFKWCCQYIYGDIERAYTQLQEGQTDTALRIMNEVTRKHAANPEAWGQQAQLQLFASKNEEAEQSLQKAFEINPSYPFGLLLQARMRSDEGEYGGALILARRAAEAYHPEALDYLAQAYALIYQLEMRRNRPLAGHVALRILIRCQPGDQELREALASQFGPDSPLPACAREDYTLLSPAPGISSARREAWDRVLSQFASPQLSSLAAAFEQLTAGPSDTAAWFNLALVQAWLGENRKAIAALEQYIAREEDEARAARAFALEQVLFCCAGMEHDSDYRHYSVEYRCQDFKLLGGLLQEWQESGLLLAQQQEEGKAITAMILEAEAPGIITAGAGAARPDRHLAGYMVLAGNFLRLWSPNESALNRLREQIRARTALTLSEGPMHIGPASYGDAVSEALVFPGGEMTPELAREYIREAARKHFEEVWIQRPLRALAGNTPLDAAGSKVLRKKLLGVVQFLADCAALGILADYDFAGLRHKLGLDVPSTPAAKPAETSADVSAMNTGELAGLPTEGLTDEQLEKAYLAAQKLDAGEVAVKFARALSARPVPAERRPADRYPLFAFLVLRALNEGDLDAALDRVNEGEKQDCEFNEGRRRNDFELRRAQVHVKRREGDQAHEVFTRLIERSPDNLKYRGSAAEGMLSLRHPARAREFAEGGLAVARQKKDRDTEEYLLELIDAAKRQG